MRLVEVEKFDSAAGINARHGCDMCEPKMTGPPKPVEFIETIGSEAFAARLRM
jgi:hypothetical protein